MKVLVISHEYPPIGGGGGMVVRDLCRGLAERGHHLRVLTAHYGDSARRETHGNLTIERLPSWRTQPFRAGLRAMGAFVLASFFRGLSLARSFKPDLIHAHFSVPAGAPAYLLSAITGIPYILTAHGGDVPGGAPEKTARWFRFVMPFSRAIWKGAAKVAAVSQQTRQLALERYHADIRVIPNGIDTRRMQPRNLEIHSPPGILFSGRFSPEKNAAAIPMILAELKDLAWRCVMLGDGVDMEEVRQLIRLHGLQDRIHLTGWVNPEDVRQYMEKSDILLMPSLREGMPMAALQGLSMGLALILPNKGSCPDLINENGFLTEPGNQPEIIQALKTLLTDNARLAKYRQNSRLHSAQFDLARSVEAYEALYQEVGRKAGG